jgi:hypothetical protein
LFPCTRLDTSHPGARNPMTELGPERPATPSDDRVLEVRKAWFALLRLLAAEVHRRLTLVDPRAPSDTDRTAHR